MKQEHIVKTKYTSKKRMSANPNENDENMEEAEEVALPPHQVPDEQQTKLASSAQSRQGKKYDQEYQSQYGVQ